MFWDVLEIVPKLLRIMAENFENCFKKFQKISRNMSDIFDKYFWENFEKYFEKYRKLFRKFFISTLENFKIYFRKIGEFWEIIRKFSKNFENQVILKNFENYFGKFQEIFREVQLLL